MEQFQSSLFSIKPFLPESKSLDDDCCKEHRRESSINEHAVRSLFFPADVQSQTFSFDRPFVDERLEPRPLANDSSCSTADMQETSAFLDVALLNATSTSPSFEAHTTLWSQLGTPRIASTRIQSDNLSNSDATRNDFSNLSQPKRRKLSQDNTNQERPEQWPLPSFEAHKKLWSLPQQSSIACSKTKSSTSGNRDATGNDFSNLSLPRRRKLSHKNASEEQIDPWPWTNDSSCSDDEIQDISIFLHGALLDATSPSPCLEAHSKLRHSPETTHLTSTNTQCCTSGNKDAAINQVSNLPQTKRRRLCDQNTNEEQFSQFNEYHDSLWRDQFLKLVDFKENTGHCCVPVQYSKDRQLARWVKRQRHEYKMLQEGKASAIDRKRIQLLESIGFVWDAHASRWQQKWEELVAYKKREGHCNMASHDSKYPQLSSWVKSQRRQYKLFHSNMPSNMTSARMAKLNSIGYYRDLDIDSIGNVDTVNFPIERELAIQCMFNSSRFAGSQAVRPRLEARRDSFLQQGLVHNLGMVGRYNPASLQEQNGTSERFRTFKEPPFLVLQDANEIAMVEGDGKAANRFVGQRFIKSPANSKAKVEKYCSQLVGRKRMSCPVTGEMKVQDLHDGQ
eukprot:scaffold2744_cov136-Cylindrotheca_fusiformis.AAC.12